MDEKYADTLYGYWGCRTEWAEVKKYLKEKLGDNWEAQLADIVKNKKAPEYIVFLIAKAHELSEIATDILNKYTLIEDGKSCSCIDFIEVSVYQGISSIGEDYYDGEVYKYSCPIDFLLDFDNESIKLYKKKAEKREELLKQKAERKAVEEKAKEEHDKNEWERLKAKFGE